MRTTWRRGLSYFFTFILAVLIALPLGGCAGQSQSQTLIVAGSTTVLPIAEIAAEKYKDVSSTSVLVSGLGSSAGIEAAVAGTCNIATSSRDLTPEEAKHDLVKIPIAHDGIAVIVHTSNPVKNLSLEQLRDIYSGRIQNWKEVGGDDLPILLVNRDEASGTREAFKSIVMKDAYFDLSAAVLPGTGQVRDVVSRTPGAIGYISIGFVDTPFATTKVNALSIDGIYPTDKAIIDGSYPISRDLFFFTLKHPSAETEKFIQFVLSDKMEETIRQAGYLPIEHEGGETNG